MPQRLFRFLQADLPLQLGLENGRWLLRDKPNDEVECIVVLSSIAAVVKAPRRRSAGRSHEQPAPVEVARATVIDPAPLDEAEAERWLRIAKPGTEAEQAFKALNRLIYARRIATADPYLHEIRPEHALALRAGFGEGFEVADGQWLDARELPPIAFEGSGQAHASAGAKRPRRRRSGSSDQHPSRISALVGSQTRPLLCEELALRARLDLDHGRAAHAALELDHAYAAALAELAGRVGPTVGRRINELQELAPGVRQLASTALADPDGQTIDQELLQGSLGRLEALLRARSIRQ